MYRRILLALDGSQCAAHGGRAALSLAKACGAELLICHVYGARMHEQRFEDMEPGLPDRYQSDARMTELRDAHGALIREGFAALSLGYVEQMLADAKQHGIDARAVTAEGRNYSQILAVADDRRADLIVLGAAGLGGAHRDRLGTTAAKVLCHSGCDVLLARGEPSDGAPIVVGVDGSDDARQAVDLAAALAGLTQRPLHVAAVYDPAFHTQVFREMGRSLTPERQRDVGLDEQEKLHDELINDGLARLYSNFLDAAAARASVNGTPLTKDLLQGKVYRALANHAAELDAAMLVVGRFGHHREPISLIGTNAEAAAGICTTNVLVTGGSAAPPAEPAPPEETPCTDAPIAWEDAAEARLARVPSFARPMARRAIEQAVRDAGGDTVTEADFDAVARRFGMGRPETPDA